MTNTRQLAAGISVHHPRHGNGRVVVDMGATVIVRFGGNVEQVLTGTRLFEQARLPTLSMRSSARRLSPFGQ